VFTGLQAKLALVGGAILAALGAVLYIFTQGRKSGAQSVENAEHRATERATETAARVQDEVRAAPQSEIDKKAEEWTK
jgi:hypothetical protein